VLHKSDYGYRLKPTDYNAAKNIARKLLQNWHTSGSGGATSHLALKSGTLNVNGIFTPTTV